MTNCPIEVVQYMHEYLDGEISPDEEQVLNEHLESCEECQKLFDELSDAVAFLEHAEPMQAPAGFAEGVMARLPQSIQQKKKKRCKSLVTQTSVIVCSSAISHFDECGTFFKLQYKRTIFSDDAAQPYY